VQSSGLGYGTPAVALVLTAGVGIAILYVCVRHRWQRAAIATRGA
ncbi:unnamed protein product, partial [Acidocella sp. C78]